MVLSTTSKKGQRMLFIALVGGRERDVQKGDEGKLGVSG